MKHIDFKHVDLAGGYFAEKEKLNRKITIHAVYDRFFDTGRIGAFDFNWDESMGEEKKPHIFWDSDVAKWMEGAANILAKEEDADLEGKVEHLIDCIEEHIGEDGYFNIYHTVVDPAGRFSDRGHHELYCAGHLMEAALAYYEATGRDRFLKLMCRYADYIYRVFVVEDSAAFRTPGHEEIELALYKLYRCTGERKYFELMEFFLKQRGANEKDALTANRTCQVQDDAPALTLKVAKGHAVRATYLYAALADYAKETGDEAVKETCRTLFDDVVGKKMYLTGGIGSNPAGEAFTKPYDLPPDRAYTETCAAIGLMLFSERMLTLENDARYADVTERVLYNGILSGLSLDGKEFFYENPLEINLKKRARAYGAGNERYPISQRVEIFNCSCCPPNLNRVLSCLGGHVFGREGDTLYVNQYAPCRAADDGMTVRMETDYPKTGEVCVTASGVNKVAFRIPSWCGAFRINADYTMEKGYAVVENAGGAIRLSLEIKPFLVKANPLVYDVSGKCALQRGPVVYCAEGVDNPCESLHTLFLKKELSVTESEDERFGTVLDIAGYEASSPSLYESGDYDYRERTVRFIPYATFANRGESDMLVWFNAR